MELIDGAPLDAAQSGMTLEEKVGVIRKIASALQEAHRIGVLHRDVKPSNILVERSEDGAWKPYIMDFGLAREMGDSGNTITGAIMGTPAFMAPEQAAGKVRSLDRRTDVYSLGATLYDVLSGQKPFVADSLVVLLDKVMHEEPLSIRKVDRNIPGSRGHRHEVPREGAQRSLRVGAGARRRSPALPRRRSGEGAPSLARLRPAQASEEAPRGGGARRRGAHRGARGRGAVDTRPAHRLRAGDAVRQARRARERDGTLPAEHLRDASARRRAERDLIRARLGEVESQMAAAGKIGLGPGHYALGRGHLTLQEPEAALDHLKKAEAAGYASFELDYALGVSLSELYKSALQKTKRIENAEQRKARVAAIEAEYKTPMLQHLRAALGGPLEAPAYVEGLIAFYEGRNEEARALAQKAFAAAPWLYEAKKLEGDALFAEEPLSRRRGVRL